MKAMPPVVAPFGFSNGGFGPPGRRSMIEPAAYFAPAGHFSLDIAAKIG